MLRAEINTGGHSVKKKETLRQTGIWLDKHFGTDFWMILLFCMGAVAGGQNVYRMARTIYEDGDDKHTKKDK